MYAIVATGGKQIRVQAGQILRIETLDAPVGEIVTFDKILAIGGEDAAVGAPFLDGAVVTGRVIELGRENKVIVFKKRRRSQYKRRNGHRQNYTAVRFEEISFGGKSVKAEPYAEKKAAPAAETAKPAKAKAKAPAKAHAKAAAKPAAKAKAAHKPAAKKAK
jgi:large subunit ribosomal protein L21